MLSKKYFSYILLFLIVFFLLFQTIKQMNWKKENFTNGDTYTASLLNSLGSIIYDSSTLSSDKITSLQKLNPPITDTTIMEYLNSGTDADTILANIKTYIGSCPSGKN